MADLLKRSFLGVVMVGMSLGGALAHHNPPPVPGPCKDDTEFRAIVHIHNIAKKKGNIRLQIYSDKEEEWLEHGTKLSRVDTAVTAEKGGSQTICIVVPSAGTYGFVAMHDKNKNGKADVFSEGFGFSNNPKLGLSKPKHEKAMIAITEPVTEMDIDLNYMFGSKKKRKKR